MPRLLGELPASPPSCPCPSWDSDVSDGVGGIVSDCLLGEMSSSSPSCPRCVWDRNVRDGAGELLLGRLLGDLSASPPSSCVRFLRDRVRELEVSFGPLSETLFAAIDQVVVV